MALGGATRRMDAAEPRFGGAEWMLGGVSCMELCGSPICPFYLTPVDRDLVHRSPPRSRRCKPSLTAIWNGCWKWHEMTARRANGAGPRFPESVSAIQRTSGLNQGMPHASWLYGRCAFVGRFNRVIGIVGHIFCALIASCGD